MLLPRWQFYGMLSTTVLALSDPTPAPTPAGTKRAVCFEIYAHQDWYLPLLIDANGDVAALSVAPTRLSECEPKQWSSDPIYVSCGCGFLQMFGYTGYDRGSDHWCNTAATYLNARPTNPNCTTIPTPVPTPAPTPAGTKRAVCFEIYAHQDWYLPLLIDANGDVAALSVAPTRLSECEPKQWSSDPIYVSCGCGFLQMFGYTGYDRGSDHWCNTAATYLNARPTNPNCTTIPTPVPTPAPTPAGTKRAVCFEIYAHQDWYLPLLIDANGDVAALSVAPTRLSECEPKQWSSDPIYVSCGCGFLQMFGYTGYDRGSDHWCNTAATYLNARPTNPNCTTIPTPVPTPAPTPAGTKRAVCFEIYAHQDWYLPLLIDANGDVAALSVAPTRLSECEPKQWSSDPIYVSCGCGFLQMFGYTGYDRGSDHWCNTAATYLNARPTNPNCTTIPTPVPTPAPTPAGTKRAVCFEIYAHQDWYLPLLIDANGDVAALSVAPTRLSECEPKQWSSDPIYVSCGCGFLQMFGYTGYDRGSDHWCNTAATYLNARPTNPNCTAIPTPVPTPAPTPAGTKRAVCFEIYAHQDWYLPLLIDANGDVAALSVAPTRLSECEPKQWSSDPIYVSCGCGFLQMFGYTGYDRGSDHWCNTAATYLNARPTNPNCTAIPTPVPTPAPTPAGTKRAVCFEIYAHQDWYLPLLIDANGDVAALSVAPTRLSECEPKQWSSDPIYVSCGCGFLQMFGYTGYDRGSDHWCNTAATYLNARPTNPNCTTIPTPVPTPAPTPAGTKRAVCFEIYAHQDWYLPLLIDANGDVAALSVAPTRLSECEPKQWSSDPIYVSCGCGFLQMFGYTGYDRGSDHWCNTAATYLNARPTNPNCTAIPTPVPTPAPTPAGTKRAVCFEIYAHQDWYLPLLIDANGDVAALSVAPTRLSECEPKQRSSDPIYVSCGCGFLQMFGYTGYDRGSDHWCNTAATYLNARPTNPNCTTIPTPVPTPAPTPAGTKRAVCFEIYGHQDWYLPLLIDANGDVAALSVAPTRLSECEPKQWSSDPIYVSCGCGFLQMFGYTGYDRGSDHWCNTAATYLNARPTNPNCTTIPTPVPTPAPTPAGTKRAVCFEIYAHQDWYLPLLIDANGDVAALSVAPTRLSECEPKQWSSDPIYVSCGCGFLQMFGYTGYDRGSDHWCNTAATYLNARPTNPNCTTIPTPVPTPAPTPAGTKRAVCFEIYAHQDWYLPLLIDANGDVAALSVAPTRLSECEPKQWSSDPIYVSCGCGFLQMFGYTGYDRGSDHWCNTAATYLNARPTNPNCTAIPTPVPTPAPTPAGTKRAVCFEIYAHQDWYLPLLIDANGDVAALSVAPTRLSECEPKQWSSDPIYVSCGCGFLQMFGYTGYDRGSDHWCNTAATYLNARPTNPNCTAIPTPVPTPAPTPAGTKRAVCFEIYAHQDWYLPLLIDANGDVAALSVAPTRLSECEPKQWSSDPIYVSCGCGFLQMFGYTGYDRGSDHWCNTAATYLNARPTNPNCTTIPTPVPTPAPTPAGTKRAVCFEIYAHQDWYLPLLIDANGDVAALSVAPTRLSECEPKQWSSDPIYVSCGCGFLQMFGYTGYDRGSDHWCNTAATYLNARPTNPNCTAIPTPVPTPAPTPAGTKRAVCFEIYAHQDWYLPLLIDANGDVAALSVAPTRLSECEPKQWSSDPIYVSCGCGFLQMFGYTGYDRGSDHWCNTAATYLNARPTNPNCTTIPTPVPTPAPTPAGTKRAVCFEIYGHQDWYLPLLIDANGDVAALSVAPTRLSECEPKQWSSDPIYVSCGCGFLQMFGYTGYDRGSDHWCNTAATYLNARPTNPNCTAIPTPVPTPAPTPAGTKRAVCFEIYAHQDWYLPLLIDANGDVAALSVAPTRLSECEPKQWSSDPIYVSCGCGFLQMFGYTGYDRGSDHWCNTAATYLNARPTNPNCTTIPTPVPTPAPTPAGTKRAVCFEIYAHQDWYLPLLIDANGDVAALSVAPTRLSECEPKQWSSDPIYVSCGCGFLQMFGYTGYDRGSDHWCNTAATYLNARPTNPNCTTIPTPVPTPAPTPAGTKRAVCFEIYAHQHWYLPLLIDANGDVAALSVAPTRLSECEPKQWSSDPIYVSCGCGFLQMFGYTGYDRGSDHWCNTAATYLNARPTNPNCTTIPTPVPTPAPTPAGTKRAVCFEIYAHQDWYLPLLIDANGDVAALSVAPTRLSECEPKQWSSDPIYVSCGCGFLQMFGYTGYDRGSDHWCNTAATYLNARPTNPNCTTIPTPVPTPAPTPAGTKRAVCFEIYAHQDWYLPLLIDANGDVAALSVAPTRLSECEPKQWSSDPIYVSCGCGFLQMFGYTGYDRGSDHWCNTAATYLNARPTNPNCTAIPTPVPTPAPTPAGTKRAVCFEIYAHQDWYLPLLIDANGDVAALSVAPTRLSECEPKQWSSDPIYVSCGCGFLQMFGYTGYDRGSDHWCNTAATYLNARPTNPNCTAIPTPVPTPAPTPAGTKRAVCFEIYAHQDWYLPLLIDANGDVAALSVAPTRLSECEPKQWSSDPIYVSCGCGFLQMFGYTGYDRGSDHWCNTAATYLNARPTNPNCTAIPTPVPTPAPTPAGTKRAVCFEIYAHQDWYLPLLIDANGDVAALSVAPTRLSECEPK
ncbi:hypothetical protein Ae201684P_021091 [Aphanomyces euteiches]|nr:hypothetical protein Ae201684P_021091 [Aphanomyces euteiches]